MNKLVPFHQLSFVKKDLAPLSNTSVVVDDHGNPLGFFFGRDTFISLMTIIDEQFEKNVTSTKAAYANPAGKIIDLIEQKLPVNPKFTKELEVSLAEARKNGWVSFDEVKKALHV